MEGASVQQRQRTMGSEVAPAGQLRTREMRARARGFDHHLWLLVVLSARAMRTRDGASALRPSVLSVLLVNHALILGGAFLLVAGSGGRQSLWEATGASLVVVGIGIEVALIGWSASLARRARPDRLDPAVRGPETTNSSARHLCLACGWSGPADVAGICPNCHRPMVRMV